MDVKIKYINIIKKNINNNDIINLSDYNLYTNCGKLLSLILNNNVLTIGFDKSTQEKKIFFYVKAEELKISTLLQIIKNIKIKIEYDKITTELKKKTDYWDGKKRIWSYKPFNKSSLLNKIKNNMDNNKKTTLSKKK